MQRITYNRTKEPRREKIIRSRRDDDEFADEPPSRRSSSERPNTFVRFKENARSNTQASMVYRRGKVKGDGSPGRFHTDSKSVYARSTNSRDYVNKRSFLDKNYIIDENRLGIYLNRLLRDEDKERQATLIRQLRAVFEHPENYMMIITEKEDIIRTFEDFIQLGLNTELKYEFIQTVGSLGAVLGYKAKRLLDWEFSVLSMSKCEDIRILILKTMLQTLKTDADKKNLSELVPLIMNKLQSALEVADVPELLISIVNVVSEIANGYPNIFSKHFSDIVDILIGWHIDATQQPAVIKFTSDILISFRQFWMSDINFTITLLGQFLEDMESYAEGLPKNKQPAKTFFIHDKELVQTKLSSQDLEGQFCSPEENLAKIRSLIRVLITVLRSVGDLVVIDDASGISSTFVMGMLKGFLKHVKITTDFCFFPDLITSANQCLVLLLKMAQFNTSSATNQLMDYINMLQSENSDHLLYESHLVSVLSVMIRFVKSVNTQLPVAFVTQMFSPYSITKRICLSPSLKIQKLLVELYHVVLAVKNVQIVEKFYECILSNLMDAYAQLTSGSDALKINLLQNICALVEIGNVKHSLIRMFALKPSFFELMTTHLKPTLPQLAKTFPALQSSILFILYSHCQRHTHFVNNSDLVNPDGSGHNSTMLDVRPPSPSSGNLEKLVALLIELLESQDSSHDSRLLASKWTYEILDSIQRHLPRLLQTEPFSSLLLAILNSAFVNIPIISKICCKSLHIIFKSSVHNLNEDIIQRCYDLCILRINSHDTELQELFASLYALLPLDVVIRGTSVNVSKGLHWGPRDGSSPLSVLDLWTALRGYMNRSSPGNFFTQHFRIVTSFILHGKEPQEKNWLLRLYHSCPPPERSSKVDLLFSQLSKASLTALWFWAVWEVAQSCVTSKLRTPLGKPQETFMAIEGALKIAAKPLKNLDNIYSEPKHLTILRYNLLLNLIEQLEKQMYNAYEGCANALPTPPKNVRTFFRTNKSTCQEWLSRVRSTVVLVALQAGRPAVALRHGYHLLEEWKSAPTPEVESVLYGIVKALIQLHCPEGVLGLYLWCKENFNRKYPWIKASVDCAAGRLEMGITEYISIFENEKKSSKDMEVNDKVKVINIDSEANKVKGKEPNSIDVHLHSFLINQIVESYAKLQNWSEATRWCGFLEQVKFNQNGLSIQVSNSSNNTAFLKCLMSFEEASSSFTKKDTSTCLNNLTNSESAAWSMDEQFGKVQKSLMSIVITKTRSVEQINELVEQMSEAKTNLLRLMRISSLNWPLHIDEDQVCLFMSASSFHPNQRLPSHLLRDNIKFDPSDCNCSMFGFLLNWENIWLRLNPTNSKLQDGFFDLLMTTARLARKQQNYIMCQKLTIRALTHLCKNNSEIRLTNNPFAVLIKETLGWKPTESLVKVQRESAKLLHCLGDKKLCCEVLQGSIVSLSAHLENSNESLEKLAELNSRCLLNLVKYAQLDPKFHSSAKETAWQSLCDSIKDLQLTGVEKCFEKGLQQEKIVSDADYQTGQLLQLSVHQCPSLAKSWYSFASWCYAHGKKVVNTASNGSLCILPEEKAQLLALAPNAHKEDIDVLMNIVTSLHNPAGSEWDNQEMDYTESGAEEIRSQLTMYCPFLLKLENHEMVIETIVDIWKNLVSRGYSYYRVAASAYLQFLKLNEKAHDKDKVEDDNVTTTLRLLRLVVKHASELRDILEDGLAQTPTAPWRGIIPQLFSRLNHPEPYVRQSISDLLCRVAQGAPHLIVFPAVVGSLAIKARPQLQDHDPGLLSAYFEGSEEGSESPTGASDAEEDSEEDGQKMRNCFAALVETLCAHDERTIREAKTLVHELHRITLLWDELWLGTLGMHQGEVNRRFLNLEKEITKVLNNSFLSKDEKRDVIKEKHHVYVKPTLFLLEQLETISNQPAETPHEQWFQKTFKEHIETAMEKLRNPDDPSRPQESWAIFKQLYQLLQQKVQQQSRSQLSMSQMSPVLSSLQSTLVPMPGVNRGPVTVYSVHNAVAVLPTKTKPKKLAFIGSDGHKYTYLFKGLEDLHLDERIMQFLSIVNNMFAKSKKHGKQVFYARHYSVTPLGPRSGLIQWVDGATPLFGLYKRWQQREAANAKNSSGSNASQMLRPSEIFYNKLTPLLKEKNINSLDNRKEWPLSVLLDVLKQLQEETPDNLLAKELWCSCSSAEEWWNVTLTYNHSTAVMSIIGYIIGLGDRHLDNVLVDLSTGEVVHIDYNVCFEKGKNLRVPEKVPFRMTPNLKTALGLTGIEGVFRVSCEHVLRVLRKGRESLLTLLEAFVYDPLVEWTPGSEGGYTGAVYGGRQAVGAADSRRAMDAHIAHSMLAIRVAEMKGEWLQNRDDLLAAFPKLETLLQDWKSSQHELQIVETALQEACQEKALLEEALTNPNHSLYTVPKRYDEAMAVKTTINATKDAVSEKLSECKKWHTLHSEALSVVCGSELSKRCGDISNDQNKDILSVAPVSEFLQTAGQGQLVQQCEHAEGELATALQNRCLAMRTCIELLSAYAAIILQLGPSYKEQNRCYKWDQWLESLLSDFTSRKCGDIKNEFMNEYLCDSPDRVQMVASLSLQLQTMVAETNTHALAILEKMRLDSVEDKNALVTFVEETKQAIIHYLKESGKMSHSAFLCALSERLCTFQKKLFFIETTTGGDRPMDLNLWNGDRFLNEMSTTCASSANCIQLLLDSSVVEKADIKSVLQGSKLSHFVFSSLEDLNFHFQTIILPEAVQRAMEPTVLEMVAKLGRIIARCGMPLEKIVLHLESLIIKAQVTENRVSDTVKKLRNEFESLMQRSEPQFSGLTQGQMLLMGFNGLFTKVDSDVELLLSYIDNFTPSWQKTDTAHASSRSLLKELFFVKKLLAMQQSFHLCHSFASLLQLGSLDHQLPNNLQLIMPIRQFTSDYVRHMMLGLPSRALCIDLWSLVNLLGGQDAADEEKQLSAEDALLGICKRSIEENFLEPQLPSLRASLQAFVLAVEKEDLARRYEQDLVVTRGTQQRMQLQVACFQWLNEDVLLQTNGGNSSRGSLMSEIRKNVGSLSALDAVVNSLQERYLSLTASIEQRLKWAAGANPSLSAMQEEFQAAIQAKTNIIASANLISRDLMNVCNSVLHFEALRTRTSESISSDNAFLELIKRCKKTCELAESCQSQISSTEEHLISLKPLEKDGVTPEWLTLIIQRVSQSLSACREKLEQQKTATNVCWDSLQLEISHVHDLISVHHKLMSEVRHILRNLAKHEEQELGPDGKNEGPVHQYMAAYRDFSEQLSAVVSGLPSEDVPHLPTTNVYDQLIELAGPLDRKADSGKQVKKNLLSPMPDTSNLHSQRNKTSRSGTPSKSLVVRDPRTGKAVQERNTYATNVWKRIKIKLDGKDPEPSKKSTLSEQVDFVIREATHPENLAVLYEGWTPWV